MNWFEDIWFNENALNYSFSFWMSVINGFKLSDNFANRGIGDQISCCYCGTEFESHSHFYFECSFTMELLQYCIPIGSFFLLHPNLF